MKKVLSVLLAAAMVMGMSVSAFAADYTWGASSKDTGLKASDIAFDNVVLVGSDDTVGVVEKNALVDLEPGTDLYFPIVRNGSAAHWEPTEEAMVYIEEEAERLAALKGNKYSVGYYVDKMVNCMIDCLNEKAAPVAGTISPAFTCPEWQYEGAEDAVIVEGMFEVVVGNGAYDGIIDKDWSINIKGDKYVVKASFVAEAYVDGEWIYTSDAKYMGVGTDKFVKVELVDDLDETTTVEVDFTMYIADKQYKNVTSNTVTVDAAILGNELVEYVEFDFTNDADRAATWKVLKNDKGTAIFDFDDSTYFTVKMYSEEKVTLNLSKVYDKAVDALFDYEADLSFYNFKGTKDAFTKTGELFIPADEDTFIYEVVDGELVEVEATWTDEYTVSDVNKEYEGWVIETKELGYYVVSDIEGEIEAVEEEVEAPVEADKANPETGAADFVGAAVAMAVVSVAAAGALALKK